MVSRLSLIYANGVLSVHRIGDDGISTIRRWCWLAADIWKVVIVQRWRNHFDSISGTEWYERVSSEAGVRVSLMVSFEKFESAVGLKLEGEPGGPSYILLTAASPWLSRSLIVAFELVVLAVQWINQIVRSVLDFELASKIVKAQWCCSFRIWKVQNTAWSCLLGALAAN